MPKWFNYVGMIIGLCEIVDGLCRFFSLGNWHLNLSFKYTAHAQIRKLRKRTEPVQATVLFIDDPKESLAEGYMAAAYIFTGMSILTVVFIYLRHIPTSPPIALGLSSSITLAVFCFVAAYRARRHT